SQAPAAPAQGRRRAFAALATLCFALAMLCKPTATVAPLMAMIIDRWLLRRPWRRVVVIPVVWFVMSLPIVIVTGRINKPDPVAAPPVVWLRPFVAGDAMTFYLRHLVAPARFAIDYGRRPDLVLSRPLSYVIWLIPAGLAFGVW